MQSAAPIRPGEQVVVFSVAQYTYAASIATVREIHPAVAVTGVPDPPPCCEGVINLRGSLVPVFDLRERLGIQKRPAQLGDHFIFIQNHDATIAYRVDAVAEVAAVEEVLPPIGDQLARVEPTLIGAVKVAGEIVPAIDIARLAHQPSLDAFRGNTDSTHRSAT